MQSADVFSNFLMMCMNILSPLQWVEPGRIADLLFKLQPMDSSPVRTIAPAGPGLGNS